MAEASPVQEFLDGWSESRVEQLGKRCSALRIDGHRCRRKHAMGRPLCWQHLHLLALRDGDRRWRQ